MCFEPNMESKILRVMVALGVPGVALGVFYLIFKQFGFTFSTIDPWPSALIAVLFLLIVRAITMFALHKWGPETMPYEQQNRRTSVRSDFINKAKIARSHLERFGLELEIRPDNLEEVNRYRSLASVALGEITPDLSMLIDMNRSHGNRVKYDLFQKALAAGKYDVEYVRTAVAALDQAVGIASSHPA